MIKTTVVSVLGIPSLSMFTILMSSCKAITQTERVDFAWTSNRDVSLPSYPDIPTLAYNKTRVGIKLSSLAIYVYIFSSSGVGGGIKYKNGISIK